MPANFGARPSYGSRPSSGGSRPPFGSRPSGGGRGRPGAKTYGKDGPRKFESGGERGEGRFDRSGGRTFRKKQCKICSENLSFVDYKEVERLMKYLTEKGKVLPRRITGSCAKHQRVLARAVRRSRQTGLIAFQVE